MNRHKAYLEDDMDTRAIVFDGWELVLAAALPTDLRTPLNTAVPAAAPRVPAPLR